MRPLLAITMLLVVCAMLQCSTPARCAVIHVRTDGDDALDGLSWPAAKKTVQAGIDAASAGDEVWVAKGTHAGCITLKDGVGLYGGFAGNEEAREERDWKANVTVLDAKGAGSVVTVPDGAAPDTVIDGFAICNGFLYWTPCDSLPDGTPDAVASAEGPRMDYSGAGIYCAGSATISNNIIRENNAGYAGGGIYCDPGTSPRITNNAIIGNYADVGAGIHCCGSGTISGNQIVWNDAGYGGGGIYCDYGSSPVISGNAIAGNYGGYNGYDYSGGGICCGPSSSPTISANTITESYGDGISCDSSLAVISGNTIAGNDCGIRIGSCSPAISNNIVAFNATGIANLGSGAPTLRNNNVYNPDGADYSGITAGEGDISADPMFARLGIGDFHLQPDSPCRNAGWNDAPRIGATDMDGQARIQGGVVDIGADESDGTVWAFAHAVVRVSTDGDDANDGSDWTLAKKTVQAGIDAAALTGGDVWVKAGTYVERVRLTAYVSIYGGFAGTENARSQRNWAANRTVLDGDNNGPVVSALFPSYYRFSPSAIDGFTIRNGRGGYHTGGVWCSGPVTVANNLITGMKTDYGGGAVYSSGYATISNNAVFGNDAGAGVLCDGHTQTVTNNTIVANAGNGINCHNSRALVFNNVVAYNSSGIYKPTAPGASFSNNLVYNPGGYDYSDGIAGRNDISADPGLAGLQSGLLHILPDSPCRDAGWNGAPEVSATDVDCQPRIQGARIDIGADESDGTAWAAPPPAVRVSPDGDDANDGSTWSLAKRTVQAAVDAAGVNDAEVWVASGIYNETLRLGTHARIYGGFAGVEESRSARDWTTNETILDGNQGGSVVTVTANAPTVDGFTIRNGRADSGGGVYCGQRTSPTISNCRITGNHATRDGGGICSSFNAATIVLNNTITANSSRSSGAGIFCQGPATIVSNRITANSGTGVFCMFSSPTLSNNVVTANSGAGISCSSGSATVSNNTVAGNTGTGIAASYSAAMISNNIIASNGSGLSGDSSQSTLRNNCVYNPSGANYVRLTPGPGDISADPRFVDMAGGNLRLRPDSPCIDSGWYYAPGTGATDSDGRPRIRNHAIDMGAYETDGATGPVEPVVVVRVDGASGSDSNDGSSWASAKKTVQSAIDSAAILGGEVWVKAGTYFERVTLRTYVRLYGGFAGTESALAERNWTANRTILDGGAGGSVVTVDFPSNPLTRIDGFTIRNGEAADGGGIYCLGCAVISNNTISSNRATDSGGGVYCGDQALLLDNIVAENSAVSGGGIFCTGWTRITNNTIVGNSADSGGGINAPSSSTDIAGNIIAFNSSGVCGKGGGPELIRNNVYNPAGANYVDTSHGSSNISADPLFADIAARDYHLTAASPCVNTGWDFAPDLPELDFDGQPRRNGYVDMGADEYWPPVTTIAAAKRSADLAAVDIDGAVVSAAFPGFFYVESDDRTCGIRVNRLDHGVQAGVRVHVTGIPRTSSDGERYVEASAVHQCDPRFGSGPIAPLCLQPACQPVSDPATNFAHCSGSGARKTSRHIKGI